jgi:MOSC domain-containing protein YiiM
MIAVGPYRFTASDVVRTLANLGDLWDTQMDGRSSGRATALGNGLARRIREHLVEAGERPPATATAADLGVLGVAAGVVLGGSPALQAVLVDAWDTLRAASDELRTDAQMPPTASGTVVQLNISNGGVPKTAVDTVEVGFGGVVGDAQRVRIHHGRPWQALCLYADEVIDLLQAEGHPIQRGSVGENITVRGLPWADVRPGVLLQIGSVTALVQAFAEPCNSNRQFFRDGDFQRMNIARGPVSRVYATVLQPGHISTGDSVTLEPAQVSPA